MFSCRVCLPNARVLNCAALMSFLALSGCSMYHSLYHTVFHSRAPQSAPVAAAPAPAPVTEADVTAAPAQPQTVTEAADATDAGDTPDSATLTVMSDVGPALKPTAPKSYVVQRGNTLWGIANMFLRDPLNWPEIWYVNPEIQNPHRIYPGDMVRLALAGDGHTQLEVVRGPAGLAASTRLRPLLRSTSLESPIDSIPYAVIASFISHPGVLTREQIDAAPYIVALAEDHDIAGTGHEVFVKKLAAEAGARYNVMHIDEPLIDPDDGQRLGYVAIYTGTVQVSQGGPVAKAVLTNSARETLQGDVLIADPHELTTNFIPHTADRAVAGRVIDVIDNVQLAGQFQVVALNRGSNDGLERGSVLTVEQVGMQVPDRCASIENESTCPRSHRTVTLPGDPAGTVLIFQTYPRMSYALILTDTVPVQVGDHVRSP